MGSLAAVIFIAGCSAPLPPSVAVKPQVTVKPSPKPLKAVVKVAPKPAVIQEPSPTKIAIVSSDDSSAYAEVANLLLEKYGDNATHYNLYGIPQRVKTLGKQLNAESYDQVIAIGLLAARASKHVKTQSKYFCQVFNYREHGLLKEGLSGVDFLPPPDQVLQVWKQLDPQLKKIALLVGPGLDSYVARVKSSAGKLNISVESKTISSDKELLFFSKRFKHIDGQWLLPDNRILSGRVLKELIPYQLREGRQMVVFDEKLLKLGGLFSVSYDATDVAECVSRLVASGDEKSVEVIPLTRAKYKFNSQVASRLGLIIPKTLLTK